MRCRANCPRIKGKSDLYRPNADRGGKLVTVLDDVKDTIHVYDGAENEGLDEYGSEATPFGH